MPQYLFFILSFQLLLVSFIDFKYRKISNIWFVINLIFFILFLFSFPKYYHFNFSSLKYFLGFLVIGIILFYFKIMGGGDSKFLASFFLLIPAQTQYYFFMHLIYTTIIVSFFLFILNIFKNFDRMKNAVILLRPDGVKDLLGKKFTFAPIIFLAWVSFKWNFF